MDTLETVKIHNTEVGPGERTIIRLPVGRLPLGNPMHVKAHIFRSSRKGPCVLFLAGMHGDETNGVEILRQTLASDLFSQLFSGSVIAIPVANVYGFIHNARDVPDGKDINRSFPGARHGSLASRIARVLTKKVLPLVDFGVDFHTGGNRHYNYPQVRFTAGDPKARQLALHFSAPFTIQKRAIAKSLRKEAYSLGKSIIVYEGGENLRYDNNAINNGLKGIKRLLHNQGMLKIDQLQKGSIELENTTWIRAPRAGMFQWLRAAGHRVQDGEIIGHIHDPHGQETLPVAASYSGFIIGHTNAPLVNQGDALFHLGF